MTHECKCSCIELHQQLVMNGQRADVLQKCTQCSYDTRETSHVTRECCNLLKTVAMLSYTAILAAYYQRDCHNSYFFLDRLGVPNLWACGPVSGLLMSG